MSKIIWIFGRSAAGKTTIGQQLCTLLAQQCNNILFLDGDLLRAHLNKDLGFTKDDRHVAALRTVDMLQLIKDRFDYIIVCMITPLRATRNAIKEIFGDNAIMTWINVSLLICQKRDKKSLYDGALLIDYFEEPDLYEVDIQLENGEFGSTAATEMLYEIIKER